MQIQVNGLSLTNLQKAKDDKLVTVDIVANHLTEDSDGETVLKEAFSPEAINEFINGGGIIDYWHDSHNPQLSKAERSAAIIGKPIAFRWQDGKPVVTAQLTKNHPLVQDMLPHLEAGQAVYAASIGGSKMVLEAKDANGQIKRVIPKIKWDHLAIAPSPYVINRAGGVNVQLLQKAQDLLCEFDGVDSFKSNIIHISGQEMELRKALLAPESVSDMYGSAGGVITKQSIENTPVNLTLSDDDGVDLIDTIVMLKSGEIPTNKDGYMQHFQKAGKKDFGQKSYDLITKYFRKKQGATK
jgi:hypothetical protein